MVALTECSLPKTSRIGQPLKVCNLLLLERGGGYNQLYFEGGRRDQPLQDAGKYVTRVTQRLTSADELATLYTTSQPSESSKGHCWKRS